MLGDSEVGKERRRRGRTKRERQTDALCFILPGRDERVHSSFAPSSSARNVVWKIKSALFLKGKTFFRNKIYLAKIRELAKKSHNKSVSEAFCHCRTDVGFDSNGLPALLCTFFLFHGRFLLEF